MKLYRLRFLWVVLFLFFGNGAMAQCEAVFDVINDSVCEGNMVNFQDLSTGSNLDYTWDFDDGTIDSVASPSHVFIGSGIFLVSLTVDDGAGCVDDTIIPVTVFPMPPASFTEAHNFLTCALSATIPVVASINYGAPNPGQYDITISWGDGSPLQTVNTFPINHSYVGYGNYPIEIIAVDTITMCTTVFQDTFRVYQTPSAFMAQAGLANGCAPFDVAMVNTSTNINPNSMTTIDWGDGVIDTLPIGAPGGDTLHHVYMISSCTQPAGFFTITLTIESIDPSNNCFPSTTTFNPVVVFQAPQPSFTIPMDTNCALAPVQFQNTSVTDPCSSVSYVWDFGDGDSSYLENPVHAYAGAGVYNVTLTAMDPLCGTTDTSILVYILEQQTDFIFDTVCFGNLTTFQSFNLTGHNVLEWNWDFGDGNTDTASNPLHNYMNPGVYPVSLVTIADNGCPDTASWDVKVDSLPGPAFSFANLCIGDTVSFTNLSSTGDTTVTSWQWTFGDGINSNIEHPVHAYLASGTYIVKLIVTNANACTDSIADSVTLVDPPLADFSFIPACPNIPLVFSDSSSSMVGSIQYWNWDFDDGSPIDTLQNPAHYFPSPGNYYVTLNVIDTFGCSDTTNKLVSVSPTPQAQFSFDTVCLGDPTQFADLSFSPVNPVIAWEWDFGDGSPLDSLQNPAHLYMNPGVYNVQLVIWNSIACPDTIVYSVLVDSIPIPDFSFSAPCAGDSTYFYDASIGGGSGIVSWYWDFGDGTTSNLQNPAHKYFQDSVFNVMLVIVNSNGCTDTIVKAVPASFSQVAGFMVGPACLNADVQFTDTSFSSTAPIIGWTWDFGDGVGSSVLQNPLYQYANPGTYIIVLEVTDTNGCTDTVAHSLTVYNSPTANFFADTVCEGSITQFLNGSVPGSATINAWNWDFGDSTQVSGPLFPTHTYQNAGIYQASIIVVDQNGCSDTTWKGVVVDSLPVPAFTTMPSCLGDSTYFTDVSSGSGSPLTAWSWDFGGGYTSILQNPAHLFDSVAFWPVSLIVQNQNGCYDTVVQNVNVNPLPLIHFSPLHACFGQAVNFLDSSYSSNGAITSWYWEMGDGMGSSVVQNPFYIYGDTGNFYVSLQISDVMGCSSTDSLLFRNHSLPIADFSFDTVCLGDSMVFIDQSFSLEGVISSWQWNFGDSSFSSLQNPSHAYALPGVYTVTLSVTDNWSCSNSISYNVIVWDPPQANFYSSVANLGAITNFYDQSVQGDAPINSWLYDFGDGSFGISQNPLHLYSSGGFYPVVLTVTDSNGCFSSYMDTTEVFIGPKVNFGFNGHCIGDTTWFIDSSYAQAAGLASWSWDFGDPSSGALNQSNLQYPYHVYGDTGTFYVQLIVFDSANFSDTIIKPISIYPAPLAGFYADTVCYGQATQFTDSSQNAVSWYWDFGDGYFASIQNPYYHYTSPGLHLVELTITNVWGCSNSVSHDVLVSSLPAPEFTFDTVCAGSITHFTDLTPDSLGIVSWFWDFGDGSYSGVRHPTHLYASSGTYMVNLQVVDGNGCHNNTIWPVYVRELPIVDFNWDTVCPGASTSFVDLTIDPSGIVSWQWSFGDGDSSQLQNPNHIYSSGGSYNVSLSVVNGYGCPGTLTQSSNFSSGPNADFAAAPVNLGAPTLFVDQSTSLGSPIVSWFWDFGNGFATSVVPNPAYSYPTPGVYNVMLVVTDGLGCSDTAVRQVIVYSPFDIIAAFNANQACWGDTTYFNDLSYSPGGTIISWDWDFGDGNGDTIQNPTHVYAVPGTYAVELIVEDDQARIDTILQNVIVYEPPVANFSNGPAYSGQTVNFLDQSLGISAPISSWAWDFGVPGGVSNLQNPGFVYPAPGQYAVRLTVVDINGCVGQTIQNVIVLSDSALVAAFNVSPACAGTSMTFTDQSNSPNQQIIAWYWQFGDGSNSFYQNPSHVYLSGGTYPVVLTVTDALGNVDSVTQFITVYPQPQPSFTYTSNCNTYSVNFNGQASIGTGLVTSWFWDFGDNTTSALQNPVHTYTTTGQYIVTLSANSDMGCVGIFIDTIYVSEFPQADFSSNTVCQNHLTFFTDQSTISNGAIVAWFWDFGDGVSSNVQNPSHVYASNGNYFVSLVVTASSGCTDTISKWIIVNPAPIAAYNYSGQCGGLPFNFADQSVISSGGIVSWEWSFGDGDSAFVAAPSHIYSINGSLVVDLIVFSDSGCSDTVTEFVNVLPSPDAAFSSNTPCAGSVTDFVDLSQVQTGSITSWDWDFGDGNSSAIQNPQHIYSSSAIFPVTLTVVGDNGCYDSVVQNLIVQPLPQAGFTNSNACVDNIVVFSDTSLISSGFINSWEWDFGDGSTSVLQNPNHQYTAAGNYTVSLKVTSANACEDSIARLVQVSPLPDPEFSVEDVCQNIAAQFTNLSTVSSGTIVSWYWRFGDGSTSNIENPQHQYSSPGVYSVSLAVSTDMGCVDSVSHNIQVFPVPQLDFILSNQCAQTQINFSNLTILNGALIDHWQWTFGDGNGDTISDPVHNYLNNGTYPVSLMVETADGCTDTLTQFIDIYALPQPDLGPDFVLCRGQSHTMNPGSFDQYLWYDMSSSAQNTVSQPGTYWVEVIDTNLCSNADTIQLLAPMQLTLGSDTNLCDGQLLTLDAGAGFIDYSWSDNSDLQTLTVGLTGTYWVETLDPFGCTNRDTIQVDFWPLPDPGFDENTLLCAGDNITLDAGYPGSNYLWSTGSTSQQINVVTPGLYWVQVSNAYCSAFDSTNVTLRAYPNVDLGNDTSLCGSEELVLDVSNPYATYIWSNGALSPDITVQPGYQEIWVVVDMNGCVAMDTIIIEDCNLNVVGVPNAFSPNGDGRNDIMFVYGNNVESIEFKLFNRFGEMVFQTNDMSIGWDGRQKGKDAPVETYVYMLKVRYLDGNEETLGGNVSLLK